jgi:hypothetical protein
MNLIVARMKWIMLVSGVLTSTMFYAAIAPKQALASTFGETLEGDVAEIVVRNWGVLIGMIGLMQIYGAFSPSSRPLVLMFAGISKLVFIGLVLSHGTQFLSHQAGIAVVIDALMVILFFIYLVSAKSVRQNF